MHFSPLLTALILGTVAQCSIASEANTAENEEYFTVEQVAGTHAGLVHVFQVYNIALPAEFPDLTDIRNKDLKECVPKSVTNAMSDAMVKLGKEHDFEAKLDELQGL